MEGNVAGPAGEYSKLDNCNFGETLTELEGEVPSFEQFTLKLNLELVNTQTQDVIWSEQYVRKQSDLVSLQSEIAKDVSTKLKIKLSGVEEAKVTKTSTANPEAYQAYLKGRYYWNRRTAENIKKRSSNSKLQLTETRITHSLTPVSPIATFS